MIKIENRSPEAPRRYHMMTSSNLSRSLLNSTTGWVHYMQPPKNMKASLHTGIRIPDSHSGLPYI